MSCVEKLAQLPNLKELTLFGNPIENQPNYRLTVLYTIPNLIKFDFSPITRQERVTIQTQSQWTLKKKGKKH